MDKLVDDFLGVFAVLRRGDQYLMVQNERLINGRLQVVWDLPGGRVEPREMLQDALRRELLEETQLSLQGQPEFVFLQEGERVIAGVRRYAWRSFFFRIEAAGEPELGIPRDGEMAVARMRQVAEVGRWMSPMADGLKAHLAGEHAAARWLYDHAATMGVAQAKYNAAFLHEARARNVRVGYEAVYGKIHGALDGDARATDGRRRRVGPRTPGDRRRRLVTISGGRCRSDEDIRRALRDDAEALLGADRVGPRIGSNRPGVGGDAPRRLRLLWTAQAGRVRGDGSRRRVARVR